MRFLFGLLTLGWIATAATIPRGTEFEIRLKSKVSSTTSRPGDVVDAIVTTPVLVDGHLRIGAGTRMTGVVVAAKQPTAATERAELYLRLDKMLDASGKAAAVKGRVVEVDNAREFVDDSGKILGILASETLSAKMDQGIQKLSGKASGLAGVLAMAKGAVLRDTDSSISYDPGTDLTFRVLEPFEWTAAASPPPLRAFPDEDGLYEFVNAQPFQTVAQNPPKPSDMTNLMFIAQEQALRGAFEAAGWTTAESLNKMTALETFRAIAEMRGYKEAPMSILTLEGEAPYMVWQKGLNTFAKRHHLRVWRRPGTWDGKQVWVSSSTQDTGIEFSQDNRTFIHKIDSRIDRERGKVVSDLMITGKVKSVALVERPSVPKNSTNATGDALITDGRMAVVMIE